MTERRKNRLKRKLQESRFRLVKTHGAFALPLYDMRFVAVERVYHMSTNGRCIYFTADWLQSLPDVSLDFLLAHQLMHIALGHIDRPAYYRGLKYHLAADIVANSYLAELGWQYWNLPKVGEIRTTTYMPNLHGFELTSQEALHCIPFDPATLSEGKQRAYRVDSEDWWEKKNDRGEDGEILLSPEDPDPEDLRIDKSKLGGTMRLTKEVFFEEFIPDERKAKTKKARKNSDSKVQGTTDKKNYTQKTLEFLRHNRENNEPGLEAGFLERTWQKANRSSLDWRALLDSFVQEEVGDYSFLPPDKRFEDTGLFLPDYNAMTEAPKEVLFLVDTSGSVEEKMLTAVYTELCGALSQFQGSLAGQLGFFDTVVYPPVPFRDVEELDAILPRGGGGTDYNCPFDYVRTKMDRPPSCLVIFTDGEGIFPLEEKAGNIPVLWLFTGANIQAPWGKWATVKL